MNSILLQQTTVQDSLEYVSAYGGFDTLWAIYKMRTQTTSHTGIPHGEHVCVCVKEMGIPDSIVSEGASSIL